MITPGTLYIVPTPIGNLEDITLRALSVLRGVDFILCEDTRHSLKLLTHFDIKKPLTSYHKFNERSACDGVVDRLAAGESGALISDAGTPLISDPGQILTSRLIEENLPYTVLPGANAFVPALLLSGFSAERFTFYGFLPKKSGKRAQEIARLAEREETVIFYVSPHELRQVLLEFDRQEPNRELALSKELTKVHETTLRGSAREILSRLEEAPRGEYVLLMKGKDAALDAPVQELTQEALMEMFARTLEENPDKKEALKELSKQTGIPKRELYDKLMKK